MSTSTKWLSVGFALLLVACAAAWVWWPRDVPNEVNPAEASALPQADRIGEGVRESYETLARLIGGATKAGAMPASERRRRVQAIFRQVRTIDRLVPRGTFDIEAVAAQIGRDPAGLHQWMREHTVLVPYRGTLRGARGVLMDRVGNTLDRSLLLAAFLKANGLHAQLARGHLASEQARSLLQTSATAPVQDAEPAGLSSGVFAALAEYAKDTGADASQIRQQMQLAIGEGQKAADLIRKRVGIQAAMLAKAVAVKSQPSGNATADESEALRDHWWVQVQVEGKWLDIDPAVPEAGKPLVPAQETVAPDNVAEGLHHTLEVRVIVEQRNGSKLQEHRAVTANFRPADVLGEVIRLQHVPMAWPADLLDPTADQERRIKDAALRQHEWLPIITVGTKQVKSASVLDTGDLNSQPGAKTSSGPAAGMLDAFGGGGAAPPGELTAEWIEYEIRSPGRPTRIIRREVFDLLGPAARSTPAAQAPLTDKQRLSRALGVLSETEILALPAELSGSFVAHLTSSRLIANEPVLMSLAADDPVSGRALADRVKGVVPLPSMLHALAVARAELSRTPSTVYLSQPNLLSRHMFLRADVTGSLKLGMAIDIVANEIAVNHASASEHLPARVEQGVLDANLEAMLIGAGANGGSMADLYGLGETDTWIAIRDLADTTKLTTTPDVRARIDADLRAGFVVLAPRNSATSGTPAGWWRVDARTGDTLAMGDRGWGQSLAEYAGVTAIIAVPAVCMFGASLDGQVSADEGILCVAAGMAVAGPFGIAAGLMMGGFVGAGLTGSAALATVLGSFLVGLHFRYGP